MVAIGAGIEPAPLSQPARTALGDFDIDPSAEEIQPVDSLGSQSFSLAVAMGEDILDRCRALPGAPVTVRWSFPSPPSPDDTPENAGETYREIIRAIREHVRDMFEKGFYEAICNYKRFSDNLLDGMSEGVMAHDLNRRIFYFSKGMEQLTGMSRSEVIGRDCHEVFTPRLCGGECSFAGERRCSEALAPRRYSSVIVSSDGQRKEFDLALTVMKDEAAKPLGVVASVTDQTAMKELKLKLGEGDGFHGIIGQDHKMLAVFELVKDLTQCDFPVIITGESGTGKELVAQAIHNESSRKDKLFVPVNCGALPEGTLESELFGHVKGAFTGAIRDKKGRFELADGGTLFLDEVAELPHQMQVRLLRVIQEGTFEPVGSEATRKVNVRIISATNKPIKELVKNGDFREDLYYRLAVVPIDLPPLRDRKNDIPLLIEQLLVRITAKLGRQHCRLAPETAAEMVSFEWPGNVRQLQNALQFALIKCRGNTILPHHLPPEISNRLRILPYSGTPDREQGKPGRKPKLAAESVRLALEKTAGNKAKAARVLGVGRATLYNFLSEHPELAEIGELE